MAGCTIPERREDAVKKRARSALEELARTSKQFCDILYHYSSEVTSSGTPICEQLFDEFLTITLPTGSRNPFTAFTGPAENPVVIVSQTPQCRTSAQKSLTEDSSCEEHPPPCLHLDELVLLTRCSTVGVGQSLSEKVEFLTSSQPLHQGDKPEKHVSQALHARDVGLLPVPLDRARFVCSLYNIGSQRWSVALPDLWVLCQDSGDTVAFGCLQDGGSGGLLHVQITKAGTVHLPSGPAGAKKPPPSSSFSSSSSWKLKPHERSASSAYCEYEVVSADGELAPSDLAVQFTWKGVEHHLSPPPETAAAVLKLSAKPGHATSPVLWLYQEVLTLLRLCLVAMGEAEWPGGKEEGLQAPPPLASQLSTFFEAISSPLAHPKQQQLDHVMLSSHTPFHARKNLDFAEHLWLFCKDVRHVSDLQEVLSSVFKAVLFRRVHPWVHQGSTTPLAELLRAAPLGTTSDEMRALGSKMEALLGKDKVLPCLVQVGIEKLRRDYHSCFVGHSLVTGAHLDPFLCRTTPLESCHNLCKLHMILELVAGAMTYLDLPLPLLSQLTREAMEVYARTEFGGFESTPVFSQQVPAHSPALRSLLALCGSLVPRVWSVTVEGERGRQMTLYSSEPMLRHLAEDPDCGDSVSDLYAYRARCDKF